MKIVIAGGGTAGWIAAYFINKSLPKVHEITIIESSSIGIIGAGEGSTGTLIDLLNGYFFNKKINIDDFLKKTDGTKKYGIKHINWNKKNTSYFAPLDISPTGFELNDYILKYVLSDNYNNFHLASKIGIEYENSILKDTYAVHFDGHKVGNFFKEICIREDNNRVIDSTIKNVKLDNSGAIDFLLLENGEKIESDLFFDCTGFSRILSKAVETKWISYSDTLTLNTAIPFILEDYEKKDPVTKAHAMSSGWMWEIPLKNRFGMGYVFDKNFISIEKAKMEVENYLKRDIDPIKIINFESGYVDKFWNKNVISFGLSSSFVEPLEATSIHNTIVQLSIFIKEFLINDKKIVFDKNSQDIYNKRIENLNKLTIDFISIHYQGGKENSDFWKFIKNEKIISDGAKQYVNSCKYRVPGYIEINGMFGSYSNPLANWIGAGIELFSPEIAKKSLYESNMYEVAKNEYESFYRSVINDKRYVHFI